MKLKYYLWLCLVFLSVMVVSCVRTNVDDIATQNNQADLTVAEAQAFFEKTAAADLSQTRSAHSSHLRWIMPGDFTPNWKQAITSGNNQVASVDVSITSQYRYQVIRSTFINGKAAAYTVPVTQKLIVVRGKTNQQLSQYMLTLIPDGDYYAADKKDLSNRFIHSGDKNSFSGVAVYALWESGIPIRVDKYKSGQRVGGVNLLGVKGATREKIAQIRKIFASLRITRVSSGIGTRNFGEDDWYGGSGCYFCDGGGCFICDSTCPGCGESSCICGIDIDPVEVVGCGICMQSDCVCAFACPSCGNYPCSCPDICFFCGYDPCMCEDNDTPLPDEDYPYIGDDTPSETAIDINKILDDLAKNAITAKLLEKVKLDKIKITPPPPGKPGQQGVTHGDGSIEIHTGAPGYLNEIILLEELMHRYQLGNDIHGQNKGDIEIEAKLLVWDYLRSENSINMIDASYGSAWGMFGKFAENPCEDTWGDAQRALFYMGYDPSKFPTSDYANFKDDNYQNLK